MDSRANLSILSRQALVKWLCEFDWKLFVSLSFRRPITGMTTLKHFRRLLYHVANKTRTQVKAFAGVEWFRDKQGRHVHALVEHGGSDRWRPFWAWWFKHYGAARFRVYEPNRGAGYYVTKYALKESYDAGTWDFFAELPKCAVDKTLDLGLDRLTGSY